MRRLSVSTSRSWSVIIRTCQWMKRRESTWQWNESVSRHQWNGKLEQKRNKVFGCLTRRAQSLDLWTNQSKCRISGALAFSIWWYNIQQMTSICPSYCKDDTSVLIPDPHICTYIKHWDTADQYIVFALKNKEAQPAYLSTGPTISINTALSSEVSFWLSIKSNTKFYMMIILNSRRST